MNINYDAPEASKASLEGYLSKLLRENLSPATTITVQVKETGKEADKKNPSDGSAGDPSRPHTT
ncbi:MAG TPA: hypothetical protein VEK84_18580 [Terriglobales bacterium]|nr:hypothetical protein [Terriglobales bacterium]